MALIRGAHSWLRAADQASRADDREICTLMEPGNCRLLDRRSTQTLLLASMPKKRSACAQSSRNSDMPRVITAVRFNKAPAMLTRLIYASETTTPLAAGTVQEIVDKAREANQRRHLTGMLAFDSRSFLQVLEGPRDMVSEVFCKIAADPRHQRVQLLESVPVDERQFATWSMGFAAADAQGHETFLRYSSGDRFEPLLMTARGALGILRALASR
jgi:hypothetical protein